jgi:uncharacterized membrane protein required for colicin V production
MAQKWLPTSRDAASVIGCLGQKMSANLFQLPVNAFDLVVIAVLAIGIFQGRKHGMSEELLSVTKWLAILFGCWALYQPGAALIAQFTTVFDQLSCYLMAYVAGAMLILALFAGITRTLGGKLIGSDIFGRSEYYLGMGSGLVRVSCILLTALALLNARYFSPAEIQRTDRNQNETYGSRMFPTLYTVQATVFERSFTGPYIKEYLGFLLIKPTQPDTKGIHQKEFVVP